MPSLSVQLVSKYSGTAIVSLLVDTEGQAISGLDVFYLNFNPGLLKCLVISPSSLLPFTVFKQILPGQIALSQICPPGTPDFIGKGVIATLIFRILTTGLTFDFTAGSTTDCNLASSIGQDILTQVNNLTLNPTL